jgi:hypothetical protein
MSYWFSFLFPWLLTLTLLQWLFVRPGQDPKQNPRGSVLSSAIALLVIFLPMRHIPLGRWLAGLNVQASIPLLGLLVDHLWKRAGGADLLRPSERSLAWSFGALAGTPLYLLALGIGPFDLYSWGWGIGVLFPLTALGALMLIWKRNRLGWLLLVSMLAYDARCLESINFWDYLVDPVYWLVSVVMLARVILRKMRGSTYMTASIATTSTTHASR